MNNFSMGTKFNVFGDCSCWDHLLEYNVFCWYGFFIDILVEVEQVGHVIRIVTFKEGSVPGRVCGSK